MVSKQKVKMSPKSKKKTILSMIIWVIVIIALLTALFGVYIIHTNSTFQVEFYQIESTHVHSNLRIVFITDLHLKEYGDHNEKLISRIESLSPDLILCGGDLVTYPIENFDSMLTLVSGLSEIAPVYGCTGNHEDEMIYLKGITDLPQRFQDSGLTLLQNEVREITIGDNTLELVGLSGGPGSFELYGAKRRMDSLEANNSKFRIVLAHVPILFKNELSSYDFDLGLAGHTHGGIANLPKIGGLYTSEEGFFPEVYAGLYTFEKKPLIVSRGLGDSNPIPRINNPHELSVIDVKWY